MKKAILFSTIFFFAYQFASAQKQTDITKLRYLLNETDTIELQNELEKLREGKTEGDIETMSAYYQATENPFLGDLIKENDPKVLQERFVRILKSDKEEEYMALRSYYGIQQEGVKADSVRLIILKKFPVGFTAFQEEMEEIFNATDGDENEKRHAQFVDKFSANPKLDGHQYFHYVKYYVGLSYINDKPEKMAPWISQIEDSIYRAKAYSYGATELMNRGKYETAEPLIRLALDELKKQNRMSSNDYRSFATIASNVLLANKKYDEGYNYFKSVHKDASITNPYLKNTYMNLLVGTERYQEAYPMMEEAIKNGNASKLVKEKFPAAYAAVHGDTTGHAEYYQQLFTQFENKVRDRLAGEMVKEPAFNFNLKTVDGKTVTLESLRDKVVVLDFWATWCGPCKASFPMMQMAVDTYKNDPEVEFLFIHTLENNSSMASQDADNYLKSNNYTFKLLMDLKDPQNKKNPAATGFAVKGIPAKFIIDRNGNICFRSMGYTGSEDLFMAEIKGMIELAKRSGM